MQRSGVWTPLEANDSLDFHSLSVQGEEFLSKTIPSGTWCPESHRKGTIPSKVFSLSSCTLLLHLFHYQVNLLSNSLAARAGVELDVPGPVGELVSHLLHHLEMLEVPDVNACFKENVRHLISQTSGPATIPLLWSSLRTQVFTWVRSRGKNGTKTSTRLRSITRLNCRPPASLNAPAAISGSSWNLINCISNQPFKSYFWTGLKPINLSKGYLFSGFPFSPRW